MHSRREFLGAVTLPSAAAVAGIPVLPALLRADANSVAAELANHPGTPVQVAADEDFWVAVQQAFTVDRSLVNLNKPDSLLIFLIDTDFLFGPVKHPDGVSGDFIHIG